MASLTLFDFSKVKIQTAASPEIEDNETRDTSVSEADVVMQDASVTAEVRISTILNFHY